MLPARVILKAKNKTDQDVHGTGSEALSTSISAFLFINPTLTILFALVTLEGNEDSDRS